MRAIVVTAHGGPEVLAVEDRPDPEPRAGQLLIDLTAAGVNFMDVYQRKGQAPYNAPPPLVPGAEGAGTVTAIGPGADRFAVGDRVAWAGPGASYAEQVVIPAELAVDVPDGVDLEVAAAVMMQGMTAHYLCHSTYPVAEDDAIVVHSAAGGVGRLLIQMVKMRGGTVIATTSSEEKAELAREAGADYVATYDDFCDVARQVTDGAGAAAVYDGVGAATFDSSLAALRPRGYLVSYGASSGPVPPFDLRRLSVGGSLFVTRPTGLDYFFRREELEARSGDLFCWIADGRLTVLMGGRYAFTEAAQAHADLESRRTTGKLLLLPWEAASATAL
jgi:NADPH2:quinone reductase